MFPPTDVVTRGSSLHSAVFSQLRTTNDTTSIEFITYTLSEAKVTPRECIVKGVTYAAPLKIKVRLNLWDKDEKENRILKEQREQEVYIGEMPIMTDTGSFIINGIERVIVSQLHRSPGVYFSPDKGKTHASGRLLYTARVIPVRGSWLDSSLMRRTCCMSASTVVGSFRQRSY